ncbi:hypothetical protein BJ742DRAFT_790761 [Cladochytrium replicatum]|nr:hypothetical protein BJ742DRAFT_790761 [Cladochytrium replicatum]
MTTVGVSVSTMGALQNEPSLLQEHDPEKSLFALLADVPVSSRSLSRRSSNSSLQSSLIRRVSNAFRKPSSGRTLKLQRSSSLSHALKLTEEQERVLAESGIVAKSLSSASSAAELTLAVLRVERILFRLQNELYLVQPILDIYASLNTRLYAATGKATSQHWGYLPDVPLSVRQQLDRKTWTRRSPIDARYDYSVVTYNNRDGAITMGLKHPLFKLNKVEVGCENVSKSVFSATLAATYPLVPNPRRALNSKEPEKVLLNDPNNDAWFSCSLANGVVVGATADGSGRGPQARLAAGVVMAITYEMIPELTTAYSGVSARSSSVFEWIHKVIVRSQQIISSLNEAGSTTASVYVIVPTKDGNRLCMYAFIGDVEGFHYNSTTRTWRSLGRHPLLHEEVRLNTSSTPGALGGESRIRGLYLWKDTDWQRATVKKPSKWYEDQLPPAKLRGAAGVRSSSNLHFGMINCRAGDLFVFLTDGLGDTIDPLQLFPNPSQAAKAFECIEKWMKEHSVSAEDIDGTDAHILKSKFNHSNSEDWSSFSKRQPDGACQLFRLKQRIFTALMADMPPYPNVIMKKCIRHAMYVTGYEREMMESEEYRLASKHEKGEMLQQLRSELRNAKLQIAADTESWQQLIVPTAKMDHLAIQVIEV